MKTLERNMGKESIHIDISSHISNASLARYTKPMYNARIDRLQLERYSFGEGHQTQLPQRKIQRLSTASTKAGTGYRT